MKIDGYAKMPDIEGACNESGHEKEIRFFWIGFKMVAPYDPVNRTYQGSVAMSNVELKKYYDQSSPYIEKALHKSTPLDEIKLSLSRINEEKDYLVITLKGGVIVTYDMQPSPEEPGLIQETIGLQYTDITFNYDGKHEITMAVGKR